MLIKDLLFCIKQDLLSLKKYPRIKMEQDFEVDYDRYWKKRGRGNGPILSRWQKQRADYILKMIEPGSSVLDIGCGDGAVLFYLRDKISSKGVGVDISQDALNEARKIGIEVIKMNVNNFDELDRLPEVDYVLGLEVIEHMANPEKFIFKIKNKAKKALIFSFPNTGYYIHRLRLLFGQFPLQWIDNPGEHLRFWTVEDVKWWVNYLGLNLDKLIVYEGLPILKKIFPKIFGRGIIIKIS